MTELEKLHAGLEYDMWAPEIDALKLRAMTLCRRLNALPKEAKEERTVGLTVIRNEITYQLLADGFRVHTKLPSDS